MPDTDPAQTMSAAVPAPSGLERVRRRIARIGVEGRVRVKTPTVLQMEAVECGAAALGMIMSHYGRVEPLVRLRHECGVSRDGSKASNLVKTARRFGMKARGLRKDMAGAKAMQAPFIAFWNFNHFLVVEGFDVDGGVVYLNDPASGHRTVTEEEFDHAFTGVVLDIRPGDDFEPGGSFPSVWTGLRTRLAGSSRPLMYCVLAGLLLVVPGVVFPALTKVFIDNVLIKGAMGWLKPILLAMVAVGLFKFLVRRLQIELLRRLEIQLNATGTSRLIWHLLSLPVGFYAQRYAGEITDRIALNRKIADALAGQLTSTVIDALMMIFYALVMLQYDVVLTAIGVGFAIINFWALKSLSSFREEANERLAREQGVATSAALVGLQNIETLKASGLESDTFSRWAGHYAKAINSRQELEAATRNLAILPSLLGGITGLLVLVVGGVRVMDGQLTLGSLFAFQMLMASFLAPVAGLIGFGSVLQELRGDMLRLDDVLKHPEDPNLNVDDSTRAMRLRTKLEGELELRDVTYGYNPHLPPIVDGVSLHVMPGQRVALVGGSGSGKSTVAKLICGLFPIWSGELKMDGSSPYEIPRGCMTNSLALVDQDIALFEGTVRENLTLWDPTVPDGDVLRAIRDAELEDVISALPGGLDGHLLEGAVNLSGGQRQRLELARALVRDPSILVLDEATSALDAETERKVDRNLRRRGCTCVVVAHRLSTVRDCDEIVVLDRGRVIERGAHDELVALGGAYARLAKTELGG